MIRNVLTGLAVLFIASQSFAQATNEEITKKNAWLKAGIEAGVPIGDIADYSAFTLGLNVSGQFMTTKNFGLGITTGYTHYFAKEAFDDFGTVPVGLMVRYYPKPEGFFAGVDGGYTFITNDNFSSGGLYVKPQVGYHNYDWNFYGFYNQVFTKKAYVDLQSVGVAATYNLRFK